MVEKAVLEVLWKLMYMKWVSRIVIYGCVEGSDGDPYARACVYAALNSRQESWFTGIFDARVAGAFRLPAIFNLSFSIHKFALTNALRINNDESLYTRAWRWM